jgi:dynamin 1-like protein
MKNQPASIVEDLQNMVLHYISDPNSIILAVTPANADVANSQALQLATRVDPGHNRTIGVLTKIDLMDRGTNAVDILNNRKYPLKLGWVGVVNRSQQDIDGNKTLADAKAAEMEYFHGRSDSPYRCSPLPRDLSMAPHECFEAEKLMSRMSYSRAEIVLGHS